MSSATTFTDADIALMVAIINQLEVSKINKKKLQADLGLATIKTAESRLTRFKAKIARANGQIPTGSLMQNRASPTSPKKRKIKTADTEDEVEGLDYQEGDWVSDYSVKESPSRKTPGRKARVMSFKEEEVEEVDDDFQV